MTAPGKRKVGRAIGGLLTAVGAACALYYAWRAPDRELARYLAEMKAAGRPTRLSDMALPPLHDSENAAVLYGRAAKLLQSQASPASGDVDWESPAGLHALRQRLPLHRPALELVRKAAALDRCRFGVEFESELFAAYHHGEEAASIANLLANVAVALAESGSPSEAAEFLRLGGALSRHLCRDAAETPLLIALAADHTILRAAWKVLLCGPIPPGAARVLSRQKGGVPSEDEFARAVRVAVCELVGRCADARAHPGTGSGRVGEGVWNSLPEWGPLPQVVGQVGTWFYLVSPGLARDEVALLREYAEAERRQALPYRQTKARWEKLKAKRSLGVAFEWIAYAAEAGEALARRRDIAVGARDLFRAALALHEYEAEHDAFPDALSEVHIEGLPIPDDVFSGEPFIYRRKEDGFLLYSVGPNAKGDGGWWEEGGPDDDITWPPPMEQEWWYGYE